MLNRIYIHNYKCLVNFELHLKETVLLLGANGAGKTAVLDALFGMSRLLAAEAKVTDPDAFPLSTLTHWQTLSLQVLEIDAEFRGHSFTYRLEIEHDKDGNLSRVRQEKLLGDGKTLFKFELGEVHLYRDDGSEGPKFTADWSESALARVQPGKDNRRLTVFLDSIKKTVICTINPHRIPSETKREDRRLNRYAENFVAWYRNAAQEDFAAANSHIESLRDVIRDFNGINLRQSGLQSRALFLTFLASGHEEKGYELEFEQLSDGQRVLVVLYALLHLCKPNTLLFIDEPDNFVALSEIQPWIRRLADLSDIPRQVVICSHHPELIDYLGPDCGILLRRDPTMVTTTQPVTSLARDYGLQLSELLVRGWER